MFDLQKSKQVTARIPAAQINFFTGDGNKLPSVI